MGVREPCPFGPFGISTPRVFPPLLPCLLSLVLVGSDRALTFLASSFFTGSASSGSCSSPSGSPTFLASSFFSGSYLLSGVSSGRGAAVGPLDGEADGMEEGKRDGMEEGRLDGKTDGL